ncbi:MAG: Negative regulator of sigma [Pseudomonadota bacterium]|jgi:hypothetical protein
MLSAPPPELERLQAAIASAPSATRQQARAERRRLHAIALVVLTLTALLHGLPGILSKPWRYTLSGALSAAIVACALIWPLQRFFTQPMGPRRTHVRRAGKAALPALLGAAALPYAFAPEALHGPGTHLLGHVLCAALTLGSGGLLAWCGIRVLRHADPVAPSSTALVIGAAAGVLAFIAVSLQCPATEPLHGLLGHLVPVALIAAASVRFGRRVLGLTPTDAG